MDAEEIFLAALEKQSPAEQAEYLAGVCGNDAELREQVDRLIASNEAAGSFLDQPLFESAPTVNQPVTEKPGDTIGPYKLLQQIGEGGMGVVYMAEQKEPVKRRVALKIIKPGMDTRQVIARFEAERQALAMMDHPNIARVLDAGATQTGRPYFVMELVNGIPLTDYCDEQRLTPKERLELFVPICQAVQHAHQKGVIHRDLKPGNILVAQYDHRAVPKVIDFGVAKATSQTLTEKTMFTQLGQIVGTLDYMSPEQARRNQLDVDTRSDIYSLGVILYELLTGETPFDKQRLRSAAFDEMLRIIREEEPPRPSTKLSSSETLPSIAANRQIEPNKLGTIVRGELDWIVMKALEKDRGRRYETASAFAADVQHYLSDEAVVACPPSAGYRFRKFARRNKATITTATVVALSLIIGTGLAAWQAYEASEERDRALTAEALAEERLETVQSQKEEIEAERQNAITAAQRADQEADNARTEAAISEAVNDFLNNDLLGMADAASLVESGLTPDPNIKLQTVVDRAAARIEDRFSDQPLVEAAIRNTLGNTYLAIGEFEKGEQQHQRARELRLEVLGPDHADTLRSLSNLARAASQRGHYREAQPLYREFLETAQRTLGPEHPDTLVGMHNLVINLGKLGRLSEAEELCREVIDIRERVLGSEHPDTLSSRINLLVTSRLQGQIDGAEDAWRDLLAIHQRTLRLEHPATVLCRENLAHSIKDQGRYGDAEGLYREVLETRQTQLGPEHPATLDTMDWLARTVIAQGRYVEGEELHREVAEISQRVLGPEHPHTLLSMANVAYALWKNQEYAEAERLLRKTLDIQERVLGPEHPYTLMSMSRLARAIREQGRYSEAEGHFRGVLESYQGVLGPEHPDTLGCMHDLAYTIGLQERHSEQEDLLLDLLQRRGGPEHPDALDVLKDLAVSVYRQERYSDAETLCRQLLELCQRSLGPEHPRTLAAMRDLAATISRRGRHDESVSLFREVLKLRRQVLGPEHPDTQRSIREMADRCTNRAWHLSTSPDPEVHDPEKAVEYAREATELQADVANHWNNLGVALYQREDYQEAVEALEKADKMLGGADRAHRMFLAMSCWQVGEQEKARNLYSQGAAWIASHRRNNEEHIRFRTEAEQLMGIDASERDNLIEQYQDSLAERQ